MKSEPSSSPSLRFADVYQSDEWHRLCAETRANLAMVAEGLRPATATDFETDKSSLESVLDGLNLYSCFDEPYYWFVSANKKERQLYMSPWYQLSPPIEQSRMLGELLGYPACCVNDFANHAKTGKLNNFRELVFHKHVSAIAIPDEFTSIDHVPCGVDCAASLEQGEKRRAFLQALDPVTHDMYTITKIVRYAQRVNPEIVRTLVRKYGRDRVLQETAPELREPTDEVLRVRYHL